MPLARRPINRAAQSTRCRELLQLIDLATTTAPVGGRRSNEEDPQIFFFGAIIMTI